MRHVALRLIIPCAVLFPAAGHAGETPPPSGVAALSASTTVEVPRDLMVATLSVTRDGPDAPSVQTALKQALDAALAEARRAARPGQVDVRTGAFSLYPRSSRTGAIAGWQGTAELTLEGRDMPAIAQLVGRIATMTVARVHYGLSRELREKTEAEVSAQAIASFRARAAEAAQAFGYGSYSVREVTVSGSDPGPPVQPMMRTATAMQANAESAPLPVEAGRQAVTVTVSGTVQMLR
ncbi:MAG TPA: SIMPL domain-containing protein [Albitalea sp.]